MNTTTKTFEELAVGDVVVEEMWDGPILREKYLGDGRFQQLNAYGNSPAGHISVSNPDPWDRYEVEVRNA